MFFPLYNVFVYEINFTTIDSVLKVFLVCMFHIIKKNVFGRIMIKSLLKGTLILTITGLITRIIGFVYKIYLSNILGAANLGIYQLVFPVFGVCYTMFGAGIQTAVSQMIAAKAEDVNYQKKVFTRAAILSLLTALLLGFIICLKCDFIACSLLGEPKCADSLRVLVYAFPLCGISSCVNGCYYGLKKATVPALTQLIEQIARVAFVVAAACFFASGNPDKLCIYAVLGIAVGEGVSMLYSIVMIITYYHGMEYKKTYVSESIYRPLLKMSAPLTANRLTVALLHSVETILIPVMLKKHGMSSDNALSVYGVLTGMAMPFILFPSTITNSLSVLLLPTISEVNEDNARIKKISGLCIGGTILLGVVSTFIFLIFGADLGSFVFHDDTVGTFIEILSFLCPFLFLTTTLSSIINGLGKTHITFVITVIGLAIRIFITIKTVPSQGISGYLISLLVSQLIVTGLSYKCYRRLIFKKRRDAAA